MLWFSKLKGILVLFTLTTLFNFIREAQAAFAFNSQALSSPSSGEMAITMTGMTSADTTINFAFRTVGSTIWQNGVFSPTSYFAISNLRKVTATSTTAGKVTLAPFTLGSDSTHDIVVMTATAQGFGLSVTGTAYTLGTYPINAAKALLNGVTYKNLASFIFGSSKGFSKARKTSAGVANYGGILATRIIGLNDTAPASPVQCRLNITAAGILKAVYLGSTLIMADASLVDGNYRNFTSDDRYTFQRSEYQLLSIFGTIEMDVASTVLYDCIYSNGTVVTPPNLDIYAITARVGNSTTVSVSKSITCPTGCTQCDKSTNCLASNSSCLFDPGSGTCMTNLNCPYDRPYALYNRTDLVSQCFKSVPNQLLIDKLIVSEKNITMGIGINPKFYSTVTTVDQFCFIYAEIGTLTASSRFLFPLYYPEVLMPQMGATNSRIIYAFTNYIYNPTYPFAPKSILAVELSPAVSNFSMVVRNLTALSNVNSLLTPSSSILNGYEFMAAGTFNTVKGCYYMVEFFISYAKTDRIAIRIPSTSIQLYINGNLSTLAFSGGAIGLNPNQCALGGSCFIHIGFTATSNGVFKVDQALLGTTSGYTTPSWREIKQIVFKSDYYCPPGSFMGSSPNSCQCPTGYYPNTTTVKCTLCNDTCLTCFGSNSSSCTSCYDPFVLVNNQCVCPTDFVKSGKSCISTSNGTVLTPNYTGPANLTYDDPNTGVTTNPSTGQGEYGGDGTTGDTSGSNTTNSTTGGDTGTGNTTTDGNSTNNTTGSGDTGTGNTTTDGNSTNSTTSGGDTSTGNTTTGGNSTTNTTTDGGDTSGNNSTTGGGDTSTGNTTTGGNSTTNTTTGGGDTSTGNTTTGGNSTTNTTTGGGDTSTGNTTTGGNSTTNTTTDGGDTSGNNSTNSTTGSGDTGTGNTTTGGNSTTNTTTGNGDTGTGNTTTGGNSTTNTTTDGGDTSGNNITNSTTGNGDTSTGNTTTGGNSTTNTTTGNGDTSTGNTTTGGNSTTNTTTDGGDTSGNNITNSTTGNGDTGTGNTTTGGNSTTNTTTDGGDTSGNNITNSTTGNGDTSTGNMTTGGNSTTNTTTDGGDTSGNNSTTGSGDTSTGNTTTGGNSTTGNGDTSTGNTTTGGNSTGNTTTGGNSTGNSSTGNGDTGTGNTTTGGETSGNSTGNSTTGGDIGGSTGGNSTGGNTGNTGGNSTGGDTSGTNGTTGGGGNNGGSGNSGGIGGNNQTGSGGDQVSTGGNNKAVATITSGVYQNTWIKIVYLLFYGLSVAVALLYIKKYRKIKVKPIVVNRKESKEAPIHSRTDLLDRNKPTISQVFINYSTIFFLKNKKLHTKDKAIRVFHAAIEINVKLFLAPLICIILFGSNSMIKPEQVSQKYIQILGLELFISSAFQICYASLFQLFSGYPLLFVAGASLGSLGLVIGTERLALGKLDNIAGLILICFFFVSALVHYIWIEVFLAIATMTVPYVKKLRSFNVYKPPGKAQPDASSLSSAPSLNNTSHMPTITARDNSANGLTHSQARHNKIFKKLTLRDVVPLDNIVTSSVFTPESIVLDN